MPISRSEKFIFGKGKPTSGHSRVPDVAQACERRSTNDQGLQRKEGPHNIHYFVAKLVLSRFTRF